jgi:hypothetical protein
MLRGQGHVDSQPGRFPGRATYFIGDYPMGGNGEIACSRLMYTHLWFVPIGSGWKLFALLVQTVDPSKSGQARDDILTVWRGKQVSWHFVDYS